MASWRDVLEAHPGSDTAEFWEAFLAENPDVLHRLLADIYRATYGADHPPTLDDLWDMVKAPTFSNEPFHVAAQAALQGRSLRSLAVSTGLSFAEVQRLMSGKKSPVRVHDSSGSMRQIEVFAKALRVHPSFFSEWRRLWVMTLLDGAFAAHPSLSAQVYKRFSKFEAKSPARTAHPENGR